MKFYQADVCHGCEVRGHRKTVGGLEQHCGLLISMFSPQNQSTCANIASISAGS